ncbi:MAG TPA: phosphatidate cytidylyltransferase [Acidiferrobacterales bacterium]|nr:phosphatidate cytidylyltransferase [Acidiferrobacterales bacterium]
MLKWRLLTAFALIVLIVVALFRLPTIGIAVILGIFVLAAAWEWAALSGLSKWLRCFYIIGIGLIGLALYVSTPILPILILSVSWWLLALNELQPDTHIHLGMFSSVWGKAISGFFILFPAWDAAVYLHATDPRRPAILLFLFVLVWIADSSAYFVGRAWGKTKLAPHVSPGKSAEGLWGAVVAVTILAWVAGVFIWEFSGLTLFIWLVIAIVAALFSVLGDLVESRIKRIAGVKDSGRLLPGHGGVFDRIDGFTAAAPVFCLGCLLLGLV